MFKSNFVYKRQLWLMALLILITALRGTKLFSQIWSNIGLLNLVKTMPVQSTAINARSMERSVSMLNKAITWDEENQGARWWLGFTLVQQGKDNEVVEIWQEEQRTIEECLQRGEQAYRERDTPEVLYWYSQVVRLKPELDEGWYYLGAGLLEQEKWHESLKALCQAIQLNSDYSEAYIAKAKVLARGFGEYRQAQVYIEQAIKLGSSDWEVLLEGGRFYIEIGEYRQAENILRTAAELYPNNLFITLEFGKSLYRQQLYIEALDVFERASRITTHSRQDAIAHVWLGRTYLRLERFDEALQEFGISADLHPGDPNNFIRLGDTYKLLGNRESALKAYQRALSLDSDNQRVWDRILDISR